MIFLLDARAQSFRRRPAKRLPQQNAAGARRGVAFISPLGGHDADDIYDLALDCR